MMDELIARRRQAQRLAGSAPAGAVEVARAVCGLQAQDAAAALLGFRVRSSGLTAAAVNAAWHEQGALVRVWCMRGTLHLVAREDARWMLPLFGPVFIRQAERRYRQLGLSDDDLQRAVNIISDELANNGPQTRDDLAQPLDRAGIPTGGQALIHLIRRAALAGVLCYGPDRDGQETFISLDLEASDADDESLWDELARRYLAAFGPARPEDLASWSGLTVSGARAAFERLSDRLEEIRVGDEVYQQLAGEEAAEDASEPVVRMLPGYDNFLLGYQSRDPILEAAYARRVHPGGGYLHPTVLVDNRLAGTWKLKKGKRQSTMLVEPFEPFEPGVRAALEAEAADLGRFLGREVGLTVVD